MRTINIEESRRCKLCGAVWTPDDPEFETMTRHEATERERWKCSDCNVLVTGAYFQTEAGKAVATAHRHRRRAQSRGGATARELRDVKLLYGDKCQMCGEPADSTDHVEPLSRGGSAGIENVGVLCRSCNSSKGARLVGDYRPDKGFLARLVGARGGKGLPTLSELLATLGGVRAKG